MTHKLHTHLIVTVTAPDGTVLGTLIAKPKDFSTGSVGYNLSGKIEDVAHGDRIQCGGNFVVIGSKPAGN